MLCGTDRVKSLEQELAAERQACKQAQGAAEKAEVTLEKLQVEILIEIVLLCNPYTHHKKIQKYSNTKMKLNLHWHWNTELVATGI